MLRVVAGQRKVRSVARARGDLRGRFVPTGAAPCSPRPLLLGGTRDASRCACSWRSTRAAPASRRAQVSAGARRLRRGRREDASSPSSPRPASPSSPMKCCGRAAKCKRKSVPAQVEGVRGPPLPFRAASPRAPSPASPRPAPPPSLRRRVHPHARARATPPQHWGSNLRNSAASPRPTRLRLPPAPASPESHRRKATCFCAACASGASPSTRDQMADRSHAPRPAAGRPVGGLTADNVDTITDGKIWSRHLAGATTSPS